MNTLLLNPAPPAGEVDRPVLVPLLPDCGSNLQAGGNPARDARRRLKATRLRVLDYGLRPFRVY
jgi:hypothetical protein